jgi:hypothetical protein
MNGILSSSLLLLQAWRNKARFIPLWLRIEPQNIVQPESAADTNDLCKESWQAGYRVLYRKCNTGRESIAGTPPDDPACRNEPDQPTPNVTYDYR